MEINKLKLHIDLIESTYEKEVMTDKEKIEQRLATSRTDQPTV